MKLAQTNVNFKTNDSVGPREEHSQRENTEKWSPENSKDAQCGLTLPSWAATKTNPKHKAPKPNAMNLETLVAWASLIPRPQKGRTKSSKQMAANEFKPLETVLYDESIY